MLSRGGACSAVTHAHTRAQILGMGIARASWVEPGPDQTPRPRRKSSSRAARIVSLAAPPSSAAAAAANRPRRTARQGGVRK